MFPKCKVIFLALLVCSSTYPVAGQESMLDFQRKNNAVQYGGLYKNKPWIYLPPYGEIRWRRRPVRRSISLAKYLELKKRRTARSNRMHMDSVFIEKRSYKLGRAQRHEKSEFVFEKSSKVEVKAFKAYDKAKLLQEKGNYTKSFKYYERALNFFRKARTNYDKYFAQFIASRYAELLSKLDQEDLSNSVLAEFYESKSQK